MSAASSTPSSTSGFRPGVAARRTHPAGGPVLRARRTRYPALGCPLGARAPDRGDTPPTSWHPCSGPGCHQRISLVVPQRASGWRVGSENGDVERCVAASVVRVGLGPAPDRHGHLSGVALLDGSEQVGVGHASSFLLVYRGSGNAQGTARSTLKNCRPTAHFFSLVRVHAGVFGAATMGDRSLSLRSPLRCLKAYRRRNLATSGGCHFPFARRFCTNAR